MSPGACGNNGMSPSNLRTKETPRTAPQMLPSNLSPLIILRIWQVGCNMQHHDMTLC